MSDRVLLGEDGGTYVLKVSKPGVDVFTANASQLLFSTESSFFGQFLKKGFVEVPPSSTVNVTFTVPAGMLAMSVVDGGLSAYYDTGTNSWEYKQTEAVGNSIGAEGFMERDVEVEITEGNLALTNNNADYTVSVQYMIMIIDGNAL